VNDPQGFKTTKAIIMLAINLIYPHVSLPFYSIPTNNTSDERDFGGGGGAEDGDSIEAMWRPYSKEKESHCGLIPRTLSKAPKM
jgi:hypothetical protein